MVIMSQILLCTLGNVDTPISKSFGILSVKGRAVETISVPMLRYDEKD
jgi:hypothetical protein